MSARWGVQGPPDWDWPRRSVDPEPARGIRWKLVGVWAVALVLCAVAWYVLLAVLWVIL